MKTSLKGCQKDKFPNKFAGEFFAESMKKSLVDIWNEYLGMHNQYYENDRREILNIFF